MQVGDLTTLANVRAWLNTNSNSNSGSFPTTDDPLLARLITAASKYTLAYLSRALQPTSYSYTSNGLGTSQLYLPNYPLVSVATLTVDGVSIQPNNNPPLGSGYLVGQDGIVYWPGCLFTRGFQNVTCVYTAGYQVTGEAHTVPISPFSLPATSLARPWSGDVGVKYSNGTALVKVTSAPAAGQYQIVVAGGAASYLFNTADANAAILISYGYTPEDLEQAVIELVCERYKTRTRIGQVSVHIGSETVSFSQKDLNDNVKTIFNQYKNVVPAL